MTYTSVEVVYATHNYEFQESINEAINNLETTYSDFKIKDIRFVETVVNGEVDRTAYIIFEWEMDK